MLTTYKTQIISKIQLTHNVYLFRFKLISPGELAFSAGQYMILQVPQPSGQIARRFISIASPDNLTTEFEGVMKIIPGGIASTYLLRLQIGGVAMFLGPAGKFNIIENDLPKMFLATGTGIGPVRSMIQKLQVTNRKFQINLFWGLPKIEDVYFLDELKQIQREGLFDFKICLSQETTLEKIPNGDRKHFSLGRVLNNLAIHQFNNNSDFYLCGARQIVDSLQESLLAKGVTKDHVHFERFV